MSNSKNRGPEEGNKNHKIKLNLSEEEIFLVQNDFQLLLNNSD